MVLKRFITHCFQFQQICLGEVVVLHNYIHVCSYSRLPTNCPEFGILLTSCTNNKINGLVSKLSCAAIPFLRGFNSQPPIAHELSVNAFALFLRSIIVAMVINTIGTVLVSEHGHKPRAQLLVRKHVLSYRL
jgi:hypothetical protein